VRALAGELEGVAFTRVIDAHNTLRSRLLTWLLPPVPVRRLPKDTASRLLYLKTRVRTRALQRHTVDRYLSLLDEPPRLPWRPSIYLHTADRLLAERRCTLPAPVLAVAPGARHAPKRWPTARYGEVVARFQRAGLGSVLLLGGPGEEDACAEVARALPQPAAVACGDVGLRVSAALLSSSRLLFCNDSGLMHLAEAVGTPVLAMFGPTSRELGYFPRDFDSRVVEHAVACRPCSRNGARPCRMTEQWCMTRSTPELVFNQLEHRWKHVRSGVPGA
jgi:heptosyltransferase-2